jgi:hypothetical protein
MSILKKMYACTLATLPLMLLLPASNAAPVLTSRSRQFSCSIDGFKGTIKINFLGPSPYKAVRIDGIFYKIDKTNNRGGNSANVSVGDHGLAPTKEFYTDGGIQDNNFHSLSGRYSRGSGDIAANFIFDKSYAPDPSCSPSINLN